MKRLLSTVLVLTILLSMVGMITIVSAAQTEMFTVDSLEQYVVHEEILSNDGYIGIPVGIKTYIKDFASTTTDTPAILYVVNTQTANVGRGDDETIISGMLERGFVVVVLDYFNHESTATDNLDWSIQKIRLDYANKGSFSAGATHDHYSYVVPQGYDIELKVPFWSADQHGVNGTIEHIIQSWNTDFLGVRGNKIITFAQDTVISGVSFSAGQSMTVAEYTASLPNGKVTSIFECIRPDGTMVDMDVRMDIIYPVDPAQDVPVMLYASSGDYTMDTWNMTNRPHLTGFLMDGYAAACYEHPYVPMGKGDHYGYYDGSTGVNGSAGAVTGDAFNGSLYVYNGMRINTAAVRMVRYIAEEYGFDPEKVGVTGISKTGSVLKLGHPNPETLPESRIYDGYNGETRYEAGYTADIVGETGTLRGATQQPWLTYEGTETSIRSNVEFVFCAVGGGQETITADHAPIYICGTMLPSGSYYGFYPYVMSYCLSYDVPVMDYVCENVGHEFGFGNDKETGNSVYTALFECANYYLLDGQAKCEYIKPINGTDYVDPTADITVKFNAGVPMSEVSSKVTVVNNATGKKVSGIWSASYGDTLYTFTPFGMEGGYSYTVTVPGTVVAENGKPIQEEKQVSFTTLRSQSNQAAGITGNATLTYGQELLFHFEQLDNIDSVRTELRFGVLNDAANVVQIYLAQLENDGTYTVQESPVGEVNLCGAGEYSFDVSQYVDTTSSETVAFCLKTKKAAGETVVANINLEDLADADPMSAVYGAYKGTYANVSISDDLAALGKGNSIKFTGYQQVEYDGYHKHYQTHANTFIYQLAVKSGDLTEEDYGRKFRLTFSVYDTISRNFNLEMGKNTLGTQGSDIDFAAERGTFRTNANQWTEYSFDYSINSTLQYSTLQKKNLVFKAEAGGADAESNPMYVDDYKIVEIVTDVQLGTAGDTAVTDAIALVTTPVQSQSLTPSEFAYVENGVNADQEMLPENGVYVSGQTLKLNDAQKTYVKLPLTDYVGGPLKFSFDTQAGSNGIVKVYGVADKDAAAGWSSETITYLNAPANDRLSNSVDLSQVYSNSAIGECTVNGAMTCTVDLTNYATAMKTIGAAYLTLILTVEGDRQIVTYIEDFEDSDMVRVAGTSPKSITTEQDHTTGRGNCYYMQPTQYTYERMQMLLLGQKDAVSVGQRYRITFWAMANATGDFRICIIPKGKTTNYAAQSCTVDAINTWKQYIYEFALTEDMLTGDPYVTFALTNFGELGQKILYVDDFTVEQVGLSQVDLVPNFKTETAKLVSMETFDDWTTGQAAWSVHEDTYSGVDAYYQYGFNSSTTGREITESYDATSGTGKSFKFIPNSSGCKVKFYGILDSLTQEDIGRTLTVSFKVRIDELPSTKTSLKFQYGMISGLYRLGSDTNGLEGEVTDAADYQVNYYQKHESTVTTDDLGKWKTYTFDITIDANMLPRAAALNSSRDKVYEAGIGMLGIGSTDIKSGALDLTMYIDDIMVTETLDESAGVNQDNVPFSYAQRFEAVSDSNLSEYVRITSPGTQYLSSSATSKTAIDTVSLTTQEAYSGNNSVKFVSHSYSNGIRFAGCFELNLGAQYTISFRAKANKAGNLWVALCGSDNKLYHNGAFSTYKSVNMSETNVGQWTQYTYTFTVDQTMIDSNICYFIIRSGLLRNTTTIVTDTIDGVEVYNAEKSTPLIMYLDDLRSVEVVESSEETGILPSESVTVSASGQSDTAFLCVQANSKNAEPDGIRKAYLTFTGSDDYRYAEKAILTLKVSEANGQILKIYGMTDVVYPDILTYNTAPGSNEDESMRLGNLYSGEPLAQILLSGVGVYQVDVTDYVRNYCAEELVIALTSESNGSVEYLNLNFTDFAFTQNVDYVSAGTVEITNGKISVAGNSIDILHAFGNGSTSQAGKAYVVSANVMATSGSVTLAALDVQGNVIASQVVSATGTEQTVTLNISAAEQFASLLVSATAGSFMVDDVVIKDSTVIVLPEAALEIAVAEEPQPALAFTSTALALHNDLAIQFKVNAGLFESSNYADPYVTFQFGGQNFTVDTYTVEGDKYVFTFTDIAPDRMGDTIAATLHADWNGTEYTSAVLNYSVTDYCYRMLNRYTGDAYAELRTLLVDLLNYGAASQQFTGYNTDALVNANLTEAQKAWGTATEPTLTSILKTSGAVDAAQATWKTAGLVLKDAVIMRFGFAAEDTTGMSVVIESGGQSWTVDSFVEEDGKYFAYFDELNAGQMRQEVTATVYKDGVAVSKTIHYSVETYAARNQNADETTYPYLAELVKAMMRYGDAAYAYAN